MGEAVDLNLPSIISTVSSLAESLPAGASNLVSISNPSKCSPGVSLATLTVKNPMVIIIIIKTYKAQESVKKPLTALKKRKEII